MTHTPVRDVVLPGKAGTLALITLDNGFDHTKPNTFGPQTIAGLKATVDALRARAEAGEIQAVGITGKPFIFAVGADLKAVSQAADREQALEVARAGHAAFAAIMDLPVPTFAFVNGAAMGGGVEIALSADYRTISAGVPALALPETFLGLVPGWGGCYLLPNLVGPANALKVIIENPMNMNRMLKGPQAFELGHRRRAARAGRLPRGVAALGRLGAHRRDDGRARRDGLARRGRVGRGPQGCQGPGRPQDRRQGARALPRARSWWARPAPPPATRPSPPRTRRSPTSSWATSCAPGSTRSTSSSAGPSARPVRPTRRWPARSPRSASSAPG